MSGASVATTTMIEPTSSSPHGRTGDLAPHWNAGNAQLIALAVIALHQHSHRVAAIFCGEDARGGADAALEFVADHAGAAADIAFLDCTAVRAVDGVKYVLRLDVEAIGVVEISVPGLRDDG